MTLLKRKDEFEKETFAILCYGIYLEMRDDDLYFEDLDAEFYGH